MSWRYLLPPWLHLSYCLFVQAALLKDDVGTATSFVDQMQEKYSLAPNAYTYTLLINAYGMHSSSNR
jgi:hypothetical protein